jgi:hypothetical protein
VWYTVRHMSVNDVTQYTSSSSSSVLQPWVGLGLLLRFRNNIFLRGGVVSLTPNPKAEGPGCPFLSGMGGPTCSIHYCQHSSRDHLTTQAPPPRQSRDTFGGGGVTQYTEQDISTIVPENKHALKTYWGVELWLHVFSTLSLDGIEWYAKHTSRFTRRENFRGGHWTEGFTENDSNKFIWSVCNFATLNLQSLLRSHTPRAQSWIPDSSFGLLQSVL